MIVRCIDIIHMYMHTYPYVRFIDIVFTCENGVRITFPHAQHSNVGFHQFGRFDDLQLMSELVSIGASGCLIVIVHVVHVVNVHVHDDKSCSF